MKSVLILFITLSSFIPLCTEAKTFDHSIIADTAKRILKSKLYTVAKTNKPVTINGDWDKQQWKKVKPLKILNYMGKIPNFKPQAEAKMMYDKDNIYVIFRVKDRFVRSVVQEYNGNVSGDACVEFFFAPDTQFPERYFNLEINAGGTPLMFFIAPPYPKGKFIKLEPKDFEQIEIAHSLPKIVDPEIIDSVTWTIEYRVPLSLLEKFSTITRPAPGVVWKANFYKTASQSSNPHWITWSFVDYPNPNFHLPQFFGRLKFK